MNGNTYSDELLDPNDKRLVCCDCNVSFVWSSGEQAFFRDMGFNQAPRRCRPCRQLRKQLRVDRGAVTQW